MCVHSPQHCQVVTLFPHLNDLVDYSHTEGKARPGEEAGGGTGGPRRPVRYDPVTSLEKIEARKDVPIADVLKLGGCKP
jgi:hypothetical protein